MHGVVEVNRFAAAHIHRAHAETHLLRIDAIEIDQALQGGFQGRGVVIALHGSQSTQDEGRREARLIQTGNPQHRRQRRTPLIERGPLGQPRGQALRRRRRHQPPEIIQPLHPLLGRIPGNQRRVDGPNRHASHPLRMHLVLTERVIHPGLIRAQGTATLQHQRLAGLGHVDMGNSASGGGFRFFVVACTRLARGCGRSRMRFHQSPDY